MKYCYYILVDILLYREKPTCILLYKGHLKKILSSTHFSIYYTRCAVLPITMISLCLSSFWIVFESQVGISQSLCQFRYN